MARFVLSMCLLLAPVTLGQTVAPPVTVNPAALNFTYQIGASTLPASQSLAVKTTPTGQNYTISITGPAPTNAAWLSTSLRPGVTAKTPGSIVVTVTPTGLSAGTYSAKLTIAAVNGATTNTLEVQITLAVSPAAATLRFSPAVLPAFDYVTGGTHPSEQQFIVYTDGNPISVTITVAGAPWLKVNPTGSVRLVGLVTPMTLKIDAAELAKLAPKLYTASVTVAAPSATNKSTVYPVTLNVRAAPPAVTGTWPDFLMIVPSSAAPSVVNINGANFFETSVLNATGVTASATVTLMDAGALTASETINIPVYPATANHLRLSFGTPLPAATVGAGFSVLLGNSVHGGTGPYVWSATGLPTGLVIDANSGTVTGVPLGSGTYFPVISVVDAFTMTKASLPSKLVVHAAGGPPAGIVRIAVPALLSYGTVGAAYSGALVGSGGTEPYTWTVSTSAPLPAGLTLAASGTPAAIAGTPTTEGPTGKLTTKRLNDAVLQATIPASYLGSPGQVRFTVTTPAPGGGTSPEALLSVVGPDPQIQAILNSASYASATVSPGEMVTLFGANLGPATLTVFDPNPVDLPTLLPEAPGASTSVTVRAGGVDYPAALIYASAAQVGFIMPFEVAASATAQVTVNYGLLSSAPFTVNIAATDPGIYTSDGSGIGQGAILNHNSTTLDYSINSAANPALKGSTIVLYVTGFGATTPASNSLRRVLYGGTAVTSVVTPVVTIGAKTALSAAAVPNGSVPGLLQINAVVPDDATSGKAVPIKVAFAGASTQDYVTVSIK